MLETFEELYVGNEYWDVPDINHLRQCMRDAYENKEDRNQKAIKGVSNSYNYSHLKIGSIMKDFIEESPKEHDSQLIQKHEVLSI